jgi:hypothetical protein
MDGIVMTLAIYNNELYAGGFFLHAGTTAANHIAKISKPDGINTVNVTNNFPKIFPNPMTNKSTIVFSNNPNELGIVDLHIVNILGDEVEKIENIKSNSFEFSRKKLQSGIFFINIYVNDIYYSTAKIIIE